MVNIQNLYKPKWKKNISLFTLFDDLSVCLSFFPCPIATGARLENQHSCLKAAPLPTSALLALIPDPHRFIMVSTQGRAGLSFWRFMGKKKSSSAPGENTSRARGEVKGEPQEHPPPTHCPRARREPGPGLSSKFQLPEKQEKAALGDSNGMEWPGTTEQSQGCVGSVVNITSVPGGDVGIQGEEGKGKRAKRRGRRLRKREERIVE